MTALHYTISSLPLFRYVTVECDDRAFGIMYKQLHADFTVELQTRHERGGEWAAHFERQEKLVTHLAELVCLRSMLQYWQGILQRDDFSSLSLLCVSMWFPPLTLVVRFPSVLFFY